MVSPKLRVSLAEVGEVLNTVEAAARAVQAELQRCGPPVVVRLAVAAAGGSKAGAGEAQARGEHVHLELRLDSYQEVMGVTLEDVRRQLGVAKQQLQQAREGFAQLAALFGENAAALGSEQELWGDVQPFVEQFSMAQKAAMARLRAERKEPSKKAGGTTTTRGALAKSTQPKLQPAEDVGRADALVSVAATGPSGLAKKQLSFCSSAASTDGSAAVGRSEGCGTDTELAS